MANSNTPEIRERAGSRELRKALLGIVYDLVSEHGIEGTGMRAIAQAADVSTGTVNYHFGNKHNLLIDAYDAAYELPDDWEEYRGTALTQLRRLMGGYVFRTSSDRFWRFWINYTARSTRDEEMRERQLNRYDRQREFWTKLIDDAIAGGAVRPDIDSAKTAERLLLIAHGLIIKQILLPTVATRDECRQIIDDEFAALLPS